MPIAAQSKVDLAEIKSNVLDWVPGRIALRDAWFPVAHSTFVKDKPVRRLLHSRTLYLWRARGQLEVAEFHPAAIDTQKKNASEFTGGTAYFPALERYGYIWIWYGNPQAASAELMPDVPYLPVNGGLPEYMMGTVRFDCASELSLENLLDLTHSDFLHSKIMGDEINDDDRIDVESTSETVTMIRTATNRKTPMLMRMLGTKAKRQDLIVTVHVHVRSHVAIAHARFLPGFSIPIFHPCVPESRFQTRVNYTHQQSHNSGLFRRLMPRSSKAVGPQDNFALRPQNPRYMQSSAGRLDLNSRFDKAGMKYRWVVSQLEQRQEQGDFSYLADGDPQRDVADLLGVNRADFC